MIVDIDEELRQQIEKSAEVIYKQIRAQDPDYWHEVISYLSLFAMRDQLGYLPVGLTPEGRAALNEALKRDDKK